MLRALWRVNVAAFSPFRFWAVRCNSSSVPGFVVPLTMPALSPTMTAGGVGVWHKKVGDRIEAGDPIVEIQTDKASVDFEAQDEGYLSNIIVESGTADVPVGQLIGYIVENEEDLLHAKNLNSVAVKPSIGEAKRTDTSQAAKVSQKLPGGAVEIGLPALSPTMNTGSIGVWHKAIGDKIEPGEAIVDIETDKATVAFEAQDEGYLAKIFASEGTANVPVGYPICLTVEDADMIEAVQHIMPSTRAVDASDIMATQPANHSSASPPKRPAAASNIIVMPAARFHLTNAGIDIMSISASGKGGRLLKGDVLKSLRTGIAQEEVSGESKMLNSSSTTDSTKTYTDHPLTNMRKVIAARLTVSKTTIPHAYATAECTLDKILDLRREIKAKEGSAPSVNDFVIRAAALACRDVPKANAVWDSKNNRCSLSESVDISIAVATEGGLITPIVPSVDKKSFSEISAFVRDLASRARKNKLKPQEYQGGSFTISNLGMFGIENFSAVINPPQACILAVGAGILKVTLSYDRRIVDEAIAGEWLNRFQSYIAYPQNMLIK